MSVQLRLCHLAALHGPHQLVYGDLAVGHLKIQAGPEGLQMVLDGAAVGDDHALIAPLVPEDVRQKAPALADVGAVDQIVGGHHRGGAALFNDPLEGRQEDLPQSPLLHDVVVDGAHVIGVIADEVLHTGPHPVVLEALDIARSHVAGQHRVLGVVLKAPPVQGTAPGVQPRAEQHPGP